MTINEYVKLIGGTDLIIQKVEEYKKLVPLLIPGDEEIEDIFITNEKKGPNVNFTNLWFFTKNFHLECKKFLGSTYNIDITFAKNYVSRYELFYRDFDFVSNTSSLESRLRMEGNLENVYFIVTAIGRNCEYLRNIVLKHFTPNIYFERAEEEP